MDSGNPGKLLVRGISLTTTEEHLRSHFSAFGAVLEASIMRDKMTGRSKGSASVLFADPSVLDRVLQRKHRIHGSTEVLLSRASSSTTPQPFRFATERRAVARAQKIEKKEEVRVLKFSNNIVHHPFIFSTERRAAYHTEKSATIPKKKNVEERIKEMAKSLSMVGKSNGLNKARVQQEEVSSIVEKLTDTWNGSQDLNGIPRLDLEHKSECGVGNVGKMVSVIEVPDSIPVLSPSSLTHPYHSRPESSTGLTDFSACLASDVQVFATHDPAIPGFTEIISEKVIRESWNDEKREDMMNETVSPVKGSSEKDSIGSYNDDSLNSMPKVIQCPSQSINATQRSRGSVMSTNQEESQATRFQIMVHDPQISESNWNLSEFGLSRSNIKSNGNDGMIRRPVLPSSKNGLSEEGDLRTIRKESQATNFPIMVHDQQRSESNWNSSEFQLAGSNAKFNGNDGMILRPVQPSNKNGLSGAGNSRTSRKERRPKALPSSMTSDVIHSRQENCPEDLHFSEKQHVIIPNHLLPSKLETAGLTFGSLDSGFKRVYFANGTGSEVGYKPHGTSDWRLTFDANSYQSLETHGTTFKPLTPTAIDRNDSPTAHGDGHSLFSVPCQNIASLPVSSILSPQEPNRGLVSNATMGYNYLTGKNVSDSTLGLMENEDHTIRGLISQVPDSSLASIGKCSLTGEKVPDSTTSLMKKNDQHAELKERAMWRAKEVRHEEIERRKEQKIRSLTKLEELDKRTRAEEGTDKKRRNMPAIANQY